ncbi:RBBP9/YdeN family alpha/beta hydrolase [Pontibacter actiniarum]|uniref:Alpha/beta hydrolase n=1 Tax=Pontibacter actiniarum TaxID=323450 RepID=A0A1X9YND5_9BACT|nr:alpha/beta hydrolase [Pontibacter actiniarum]ARS34331.1 alpha/beta hydrolase [Pontibacter actiniarum]
MQHSTVILVPGLGDSGPEHWQTLWQQQHPEFERVRQRDWEAPVRQEWVETLDKTVQQHRPEQVVLVAHSLACIAVAFWAQQHPLKIKGALLVAPADTEAASFPAGATGFAPVPMERLPFRSMVVSSSNDPYVSAQRAQQLAEAWGSRYVNIGMAGHINASSGYGRWNEGLELLKGLTGQ